MDFKGGAPGINLQGNRICKITKVQNQIPKVKCEGENLGNVYKFKYLGSIFATDDSQMFDIERRVTLAMRRCEQLRQSHGAIFRRICHLIKDETQYLKSIGHGSCDLRQ